MPRDGSGVYTLPAGNPVITDTVISSVWANTTLSDIAAQLNNVFTRDGTLGPTGPFKIMDGTVNAPGLAWNSEPGLGFWRSGTGSLKIASAGLTAWGVTSTGTDTFVAQYARSTTGKTILTLANAPQGSVNFNQLDIGVDANQASLSWGAVGTAAKKPFLFAAASAYLFDNNVSLTVGPTLNATLTLDKTNANNASDLLGTLNGNGRWLLRLGQGGTDDFALHRYNDANTIVGTPITIRRSDGAVFFNEPAPVTLTGPLTVAGLLSVHSIQVNNANGINNLGGLTVAGLTQLNGALNVGGPIGGSSSLSIASGMGMRYDGAQSNFLSMGGGSQTAWNWQWNRSNGTLTWLGGTTNQLFSIDGGGGTTIAGFMTAAGRVRGGDGYFGNVIINDDGAHRNLWWVINDWGLRWRQDTGTTYFIGPGGKQLLWVDGGAQFNVGAGGNGWKPGGGAWADNSDERIKENIVDYTRGLDAILALRPRSFNFKEETGRDPSKTYIGFIAQEAMVPMPEMVAVAPEGDLRTLGTLEYSDMLTLEVTPLFYALVNAVKTLNERITQLETP